jgi:hypothetical protein
MSSEWEYASFRQLVSTYVQTWNAFTIDTLCGLCEHNHPQADPTEFALYSRE